MSIIVSRNGLNATKIDRTVIHKEDYLQSYIYANPNALPLHELKNDLRLLILAREFPTGSGPIDALGIDMDGELYVIETKLYKNSDKRLVIAQMLDYGASLWQTYQDSGDFLVRLEQYVQLGLGKGLAAAVQDFYGADGQKFVEITDAMKQNLSAGTFKFIVLMDRLDERLKHLISFVNSNSRFTIIGVELDFYQHEDFEIIIPNFYGAEQKKDLGVSTGGSARRRWDEVSFFENAALRLEQQGSDAIRRVYEWAGAHDAEVSWGTGTRDGSYSIKFQEVNQRSVLSVFSSGRLTVNFGYLSESETAKEFAAGLAELLNQAGFFIPSDFSQKFVSFDVSDWAPKVDALIMALDQALIAA
jgi:hypothetical protein